MTAVRMLVNTDLLVSGAGAEELRPTGMAAAYLLHHLATAILGTSGVLMKTDSSRAECKFGGPGISTSALKLPRRASSGLKLPRTTNCCPDTESKGEIVACHDVTESQRASLHPPA